MPGSYIPFSSQGGVFLEFSRNCFRNLQPHCFTIKGPKAMLEQWVGLNFKDNFGSSFIWQFWGRSLGERKSPETTQHLNSISQYGSEDGAYYHVFKMTCFYGTCMYIDIYRADCTIFVLKSWEQSFKIHKYLCLIHMDVWQKTITIL